MQQNSKQGTYSKITHHSKVDTIVLGMMHKRKQVWTFLRLGHTPARKCTDALLHLTKNASTRQSVAILQLEHTTYFKLDGNPARTVARTQPSGPWQFCHVAVSVFKIAIHRTREDPTADNMFAPRD